MCGDDAYLDESREALLLLSGLARCRAYRLRQKLEHLLSVPVTCGLLICQNRAAQQWW